MKPKCRYWNDPANCHYCESSEGDKLQWRACHRVVTYLTYRIAVIVGLLVGLWVGFWIGVIGSGGKL